MDIKSKISTVLYLISAFLFIGYLITKESSYMAAGGLVMIVAGLLLIFSKNKK